jgi:hypothetical protein
MAFIRGKQAASNLADCGCSRQQPQLSGYGKRHNLRGLRDEISDMKGELDNLYTMWSKAKQTNDTTALPGIEADIKRLQDKIKAAQQQAGGAYIGGQTPGAGGDEQSWFTKQTLIDGVDNWVPVAVGGVVLAGGLYYALS